MICAACPRACHTDREYDKPSHGFCKMPYNAVIARAALHMWEEPVISGENGSGAIFFSGCSLRCVFCQNYDISHDGFGKSISEERFIDIMKELVSKGAHNINLVNPTHFVPFIRGALEKYKPPVPVVYNTGGYDRVESIKSLDGLVDIYLPDLKYYDADVSAKYSAAPDYFEKASEAVLDVRPLGGPAGPAEASGTVDILAAALISRRHVDGPGQVQRGGNALLTQILVKLSLGEAVIEVFH